MSNNTTVDIKGDNEPLNKTLSESARLIAEFGNRVSTGFSQSVGTAIQDSQKDFVDFGNRLVYASGRVQEAIASASNPGSITDETARAIDASASMFDRFGSTLAQTVTAISTSVTAIIHSASAAWNLAVRAFDFGTYLVEAYAEAEEASNRLNGMLRANAYAAGFTSAQLMALADDLELVTNFESEATLGAMSLLASFRNIRGDVFIGATRAALDMAAAMGGDVSGAATQLGKALNDPVRGLTILEKAGIRFTEAEATLINQLVKTGEVAAAQEIILQKLQERFGGVAEEIGAGASGKLNNFREMIGNLAEDIGATLIPILDAVTPAVQDVIEVMKGFAPVVAMVAKEFSNGVNSIRERLEPFRADFISTAATIWQAMEDMTSSQGWERFFLRMEIGVIAFGNKLAWVLTEALPTDFANAFTYAGKVISTWAENSIVILNNLRKNFQDFFAYVASGGTAGGKQIPLLEGTSALPAIPKDSVPKREKGKLEKELEARLLALDTAAAESTLQKEWEIFKAVNGIDDNGNKIEKPNTLTNTASNQYNVEDFTVDEKAVKAGEEFADNAFGKLEAKFKKDTGKKQGEKDKEQSASFESLEALNKRIQSAAAAGEDKAVAEAKKQNEKLEKLIGVAEKQPQQIADKIQEGRRDDLEAQQLDAEAFGLPFDPEFFIDPADRKPAGAEALPAVDPFAELDILPNVAEDERQRDLWNGLGMPDDVLMDDVENHNAFQDWINAPIEGAENIQAANEIEQLGENIADGIGEAVEDVLNGNGAQLPAETANNLLRDNINVQENILTTLQELKQPMQDTAVASKTTSEKVDNVGKLY